MAQIKKMYEDSFDGVAYLANYAVKDFELKWIVEDFYHRLFAQKKLVGKNMLDVGSGPTVRAAISASGYISNIYLSDFLESNRKIVEKWLRNDPTSVQYTSQFKHIAQLEGIEDSQVLEKRVRNAVKGVLPCDILLDNPLNQDPPTQFDVVTSSLCVDCYPEDQDYFLAFKNLATLLRPGGNLALVATNNCDKYAVGDAVYPVHWVDEEKLKRAIIGAKLELVELKEFVYRAKHDVDYDNKGFFTVLARKNN